MTRNQPLPAREVNSSYKGKPKPLQVFPQSRPRNNIDSVNENHSLERTEFLQRILPWESCTLFCRASGIWDGQESPNTEYPIPSPGTTPSLRLLYLLVGVGAPEDAWVTMASFMLLTGRGGLQRHREQSETPKATGNNPAQTLILSETQKPTGNNPALGKSPSLCPVAVSGQEPDRNCLTRHLRSLLCFRASPSSVSC